MRILVVGAYVSKDGAYGGPVSVAFDQAAALEDLGHAVSVAAGWDGAASPSSPAHLELFRAYRPSRRTFVGLISPGLLRWLRRHVTDFDVVHVHVTRDFVTLPAAWIAQRRGVPVVLQTHGQIRPDRSSGQALLDGLVGRRVLDQARAVLALTSHEEDDLRTLGVSKDRIQRLPNGVPAAARHAAFHADEPLVLFNSRLADRKRPRAFVAAAGIVARTRPDVRFEIWGPDGGELNATLADIQRLGLAGRCVYRGASSVEASRARLAEATALILPSVAEPFPMALLEAFSAGLPSVITDETGLSPLARRTGAARVTSGTPEELAAATLGLLEDESAWAACSEAAVALAADEYSMLSVARRLAMIYRASENRSDPASFAPVDDSGH